MWWLMEMWWLMGDVMAHGDEMAMGMRWLIGIVTASRLWWLEESDGPWGCDSSLICNGSWGWDGSGGFISSVGCWDPHTVSVNCTVLCVVWWLKACFFSNQVSQWYTLVLSVMMCWTAKNIRFMYSQKWNCAASLRVPKCEIFDRSNFPDFYTIKSSWVGDLVVKILTYYYNFWGS